MGSIKKVEGDRIFLAPFDSNYSAIYAQWLNKLDPGVYLSTLPLMITPDSVKEYHASASAQGDHIFGIWLVEERSLIGSCGLHHIDTLNRRAEIGIYIGEDKQQNQGYGKETILLLLDYGFQILNLNSIYLQAYSYNTRAIQCYERCGFKTVGRLREARLINGRKYDHVYMDILASEFPGYRLKERIHSLLEGE